MRFWKKLIPRNEREINFQYAKVTNIYHILKRAKPKNSTESDISIRILMKLTPVIDPHITHLVMTIIFTEQYPQILKKDRIKLSLKPDKCALHNFNSIRSLQKKNLN